ncbi:MAG TPA: MFS transporter [Dehalococcoidia bacterium]|nr:MFS transporter [Dehalococcoidia bacterium]
MAHGGNALTAPPAPARAGSALRPPSRRYLIFSVIALALLMASIDSTIVAVALEAIGKSLHTSVVWETWTITAYQLGQLLVLPVAGKLSDEWGRKRVFLGAIVLFTGSSLLCGMAPNVYVLVVCRLVQALGGGSFIPSCTGIVSDLFPQSRARAIGLFTSIFPIGGLLGPNIGGAVVDHLSWRFVFWVNVPLGLLVIALTAALYRDEGRATGERRRIDFAGAALYGGAMIMLLFALTWLGESANALRNPLVWLLLASVPLLLVLFFRTESRTADPVIAPVLLKHRPFLAANLYNFCFGAGVFGVMAFLPTYFQNRYGVSATLAGALLTPRAMAMIVTSTLCSIFIIRLGYRLPMVAGMSLQALAMLLLSRGLTHVSLLGVGVSDVVWLSMITALIGLGLGISQPAANNAALDLLPGKVAAVTGIRSTFRQSGGMIGTAMIPLVLSRDPHNVAGGLEHVYIAYVVLYLLCIVLAFFIPDRARERRQGAPPRTEEPATLVPRPVAAE